MAAARKGTTAKKTVKAKDSGSAKRAALKSGSKPGKAAPPSKAASRPPMPEAVFGAITHTELATSDPEATKAWARKVLGWSFTEPFMMGAGDPYHLFHYSKAGGGGIMRIRDGEAPRATPYVNVDDVAKSIGDALKAGAKHLMGPETVMPGVVIALVEAPGGVQVGFSGPK